LTTRTTSLAARFAAAVGAIVFVVTLVRAR
jgi:hypothetical protein